jgi:hypothetical protein
MATYADIISALDAAIESWAGRPQSLSIDGKLTVYRTFDDLIKARTYYAGLLNGQRTTQRFSIAHIKSGGLI